MNIFICGLLYKYDPLFLRNFASSMSIRVTAMPEALVVQPRINSKLLNGVRNYLNFYSLNTFSNNT